MHQDYRGALEAVERILNRGGDPTDVLTAVLEALRARGVDSARVRFIEAGVLVDGPAVGGDAERLVVRVVFDGAEVGSLELAVDDVAFAERVATLVSPYVRAGSDTAGEEPLP